MFDVEQVIQTLSQHNYEYKEIIGEGGFSSVLLCKSLKYNQDFAVKRAVKHKLTKNEYNTLIALNHPNIIKIYDAFEDEYAQYIVMEYCPNSSILNKGKLTFNQFIFYARQILDALSYCHSQKIAHRDIKPENILLDQYCNVKLADFGLAKHFEYDMKSKEKCGSIKFFAPEMFLYYKISPYKADIWALGVTFFCIATGKYPFAGDTNEQIKKSILIGDFNYARFQIDQRIQFLIDVMTQHKIELRPSAEKLLKLQIFSKSLEDKRFSYLTNQTNRQFYPQKIYSRSVMSNNNNTISSSSSQNSSSETNNDGKKVGNLPKLRSYRLISPYPSLQQLNLRFRSSKYV